MLRQLFIVLIILFAVTLAILGVSLPREQLRYIIIITNFFDIMIPILAVGGLVNYLWKGCDCKCTRD